MLAMFRRHLDSWVARLFFLLLVSTFVLWGVGDVVRNFGNDGSVATVGDQKIEMPEMQDAYRRQLDQVTRMFGGKIDPTPEMKKAIAAQALERVITRTALAEGVRKFGIAVPDDILRQAIFEMPAFRGPQGTFDRATYDSVLRNNNLSEPRFLGMMRADIAQRQLLDPARSAGFSPETLTKEVYAFQQEKRVADIVTLTFAAAPAPDAPTEAQLTRWYDNHLPAYSTPEYRRIKLIVLSPELTAREVTVTDDDVKSSYEARRAEFGQPERRSLQVLLADDEAKAKAIVEKWRAGADWAALQTEFGTGTELPNATREQIPSAELAAAAFAAAQDAVGEPVKGPFGLQVFKVTAVQPGNVKSFAEVSDLLRKRIAAERAADLVYERSAKIEDLLAGGTPLDELPGDFGLAAATGTLDATGMTTDGTPAPIPGGDAIRNALIQAAFSTPPNTPPRLIEGPRAADAGQSYFAFAVESITPPAAKPFADVKESVTADWIADARRAARIMTDDKAGKPHAEAVAAHALTPGRLPPATRSAGAEGLPAQLVEPLFALKQGEPTMTETPDGFVVAVLAEIIQADDSADPAGYGQARNALAEALSNDIQAILTLALRNRASPKINTAVFNTLTTGGE